MYFHWSVGIMSAGLEPIDATGATKRAAYLVPRDL
jgi:hypothetical protein